MTETLELAALTRERTRLALAQIGLRLAEALQARFGSADAGGQDSELGAALRFTRDYAQRSAAGAALAQLPPDHPLQRLTAMFEEAAHAQLFADLLLLAALPELHEAYATLCRLLHARGESCASVSLALHWLEHECGDDEAAVQATREAVEELLVHSPLATLGLLQLEGEGPWHSRNLSLGPGVWAALQARAPQLPRSELLPGFASVPGLDSWLAQSEVQHALRALREGEPCAIVLLGGSAAMRATRARLLLGQLPRAAVRVRLPPDGSEAAKRSLALEACCAAFALQACPWLDLDEESPDQAAARWSLPAQLPWPGPLLLGAAQESSLPELNLPLLCLRIEALPASARRSMWRSLLPQLGEQAGLLAARYPIEPDEARGLLGDLALRQRTAAGKDARLDFDDIGDCLRARSSWRARPGVRRILPRAQWRDLLLPQRAAQQLSEAVLRVQQQLTVLDDWGFEQGCQNRRGLRMLFFGPPGTGKTLAAEAMARSLGVDLLAVDLSSLVSKWLGETEKNLAAVFDLAERSRALLLFDEADALFGRRSEGGDAHDRYANLETAFLLQRLERYEGVAILATNLRASLDQAFMRRFEFIVEFPEPDQATREQLWRLHLPAEAPLHSDTDLAELADWYALSGAQIRNAALAAAFLAAAERGHERPAIRQTHFLSAIEREYEKAGKAFPGLPPRTRPDAPLTTHLRQ